MRAAGRLPLCTFSVISTTIKSTPLSANTGRSIIPTILRLESPVHKTFTRVVTRQFDAHNIDTFFPNLYVYIYIYYISSSIVLSVRSVAREGISFFLFPFLRIERETADRIDRATIRCTCYKSLFLSREEVIAGRKKISLSFFFKEDVSSYRHRRSRYRIGLNLYPPRATSGTLYYPDVVSLPTRARNTFSRGYSRAYLITGFNCFRESVLSSFPLGRPLLPFRGNLAVPIIQ